MTRITVAGNVFIPAILVLEKAQFVVTQEMTENGELWRARRGALELLADDPVHLLGLAQLHEVRGDHWRASDEEFSDVVKRFKILSDA